MNFGYLRFSGHALFIFFVIMLTVSNSSDSPEQFTIYFADDDDDDHNLFAEAVNEIPPLLTVTYTHACEHLLTALKTTTRLPNLIFLDLNIPKMGGLECLKRIKSNALYAAIPVVIYSTSCNDRDIQATFIAGAWYYLCKSTRFQYLTSSLLYLIEEYNKGAEKPRPECFLLHESRDYVELNKT